MENEKTVVYDYSAKETSEIRQIRAKYLPREESKLDELRRLDSAVRNSGRVESITVGIIGALIFGVGMCLAMQVIAEGVWAVVLGVLVGLVGAVVMLCAYPICRKISDRAKARLAPRILELSEELPSTNRVEKSQNS